MISSETSNPNEARAARRNLYIFIAVVIVAGALLAILTSGSNNSTLPPAASTIPTTSTTVITTATPQEEATIATISVARAAIYLPASPTTPITAHDITLAAASDKGTLIILDNLGAVSNYPRLVVFKWKFGAAPVTACATIPRTRALAPSTLKATPCPRGL